MLIIWLDYKLHILDLIKFQVSPLNVFIFSFQSSNLSQNSSSLTFYIYFSHLTSISFQIEPSKIIILMIFFFSPKRLCIYFGT